MSSDATDSGGSNHQTDAATGGDSHLSSNPLADELSAYARRDSWVWRDVATLLLRGSREIDRLQAAYDQLTGERFSDRVHAALKDRAKTAEARLSEANAELQQLREAMKHGDPHLVRLRQSVDKLVSEASDEPDRPKDRPADEPAAARDVKGREPVFYRHCFEHRNVPWNFTVRVEPYQFRTVCPICEPPEKTSGSQESEDRSRE